MNKSGVGESKYKNKPTVREWKDHVGEQTEGQTSQVIEQAYKIGEEHLSEQRERKRQTGQVMELVYRKNIANNTAPALGLCDEQVRDMKARNTQDGHAQSESWLARILL